MIDPLVLRFFYDEMEKDAISGESAGIALANRVRKIKNTVDPTVAAVLSHRTSGQMSAIKEEFGRRHGVLHDRVMLGGGGKKIEEAGEAYTKAGKDSSDFITHGNKGAVHPDHIPHEHAADEVIGHGIARDPSVAERLHNNTTNAESARRWGLVAGPQVRVSPLAASTAGSSAHLPALGPSGGFGTPRIKLPTPPRQMVLPRLPVQPPVAGVH